MFKSKSYSHMNSVEKPSLISDLNKTKVKFEYLYEVEGIYLITYLPCR